MLEVVAAFIREGEKFLICQRPAGKNCAFGWEFPGGKIEPGETKAEALIRECREELAVTLDVKRELADVVHDYGSFSIHLTLLETMVAEGEPTALEHNDIRWITFEQIPDFDFCPADRKLIERLCLRRSWLDEEAIAHIRGWDFSHIEGRYGEEEDLPWSYREIIHQYRRDHMRLLDIDTGGGEFLCSLKHPFENCAASEEYPPNAALCRETLRPLGIDFREGSAEKLPFEDGRFDLVLNRHGDFDAAEIHRVLKKGGCFITQQVGAENDRELVHLLLPGVQMPFPEQYLDIAAEKFRRAGFRILRAEEAFRPIVFFDVGALVWFARIIEWEFPGFSVEGCIDRLWQAQEILEQDGKIEGSIHRFLLVAEKI